MAVKQPNTICKNRDCHRGADGGRKHYFSCRYCAHTENWRSVACCWECYMAYQSQLIAARANGEAVDLLPERTDMDREEVQKLIFDTPVEQVVFETQEELADELADHPGMGFDEIVDAINQELDREVQ